MSCLNGKAMRVGLLDVLIGWQGAVAKALKASSSVEEVEKGGENKGEKDKPKDSEHQVDHMFLAIVITTGQSRKRRDSEPFAADEVWPPGLCY